VNESEALADIKASLDNAHIPGAEKEAFIRDFEKALNSNSVMKVVRLRAIMKKYTKLLRV
jgi:hypothetical protein